VIFSEGAMNYEEGKWDVTNGIRTFLRDSHMEKMPGGKMHGFAQNSSINIYKHGNFVSGSSVRKDAQEVLKPLLQDVRISVLPFLKVSNYCVG
jgi:hypothetical protein